MSIMKQVITTYINHFRHLIPDGIHRHESLFYMRDKKPVLSTNGERQPYYHWYHFSSLWYDPAGDRTRDLPHTKRTLLVV